MAAGFIKAGAAALGVGSDLVDTRAPLAGDDKVITEGARQFVEIIKLARDRTLS